MTGGTAARLALSTAPLGASALAARVLAARHPVRLTVDFAQPLVVATAWGAYGSRTFALLAAGVALSTVLVIPALARVAREPRATDRRAIVLGAMLGLAGAAAWPVVFSSDVYAYAAYGALAERGFDPYLPAPSALHEPFVDAARWQWQGTVPVDIYGPASLALARACVRLAGHLGVGATLELVRGAACGAFLASVALLGFALRDSRAGSLLLGAYALNPVVLWSVAEGHNDAYVALGVALAAAAARSGYRRGGAVVAGLLPVLKATGGIFAIGYALEAWRAARGGEGRSARLVGLTLASSLALAVACAAPPLLRALGSVRAHGRYAPELSAQGVLGPLAALALAGAAVAWGIRRLVCGDPRGYAWCGIAAALCLPNAYPWYALWLVPCALLAGSGPAAVALWGATISGLVRYLPDASGTLSGPAAATAAAVAIAPLGLALAEFGPFARYRK
ncbi:MAG: hypothetical protein NVS3B10_12120 [Polyangiales bacterium]